MADEKEKRDSGADPEQTKTRDTDQGLGRMIGYTAPLMVAALVGQPGVAFASP